MARRIVVLACLAAALVAMTLVYRASRHTEQLQIIGHAGCACLVPGMEIVVGAKTAETASIDLVAININDRTYAPLLETPDADELSPAVSPDGKAIAFVSEDRRTGQSDLCVLELSSGRIVRLTNTAEYEFGPAFSADGRSLLFVRAARERPYSMGGKVWDQWDVWRISIADRRETPLTWGSFRQMSPISTSPDGTTLAFSASDDSATDTIYTADLSQSMEGLPLRLVPKIPHTSKEIDSNPIYARDSKTIFFISNRVSRPSPYDYELWSLDTRVGATNCLTSLRSYVDSPVVVDDRRVCFLHDVRRDDVFKIAIYDSQDQSVRQLSGLSRR